ncbi:MAG: metal ABC transporter substrate-binding protein [candidate division WOR-3 bacterium]
MRSSLLFLLTVLTLASGCRSNTRSRLKVLVSTNLIATIVQAVGGERVEVTPVVPAGICPGHFDLPPSAMLAASRARLLINHGWEQWFPKLTDIANRDAIKATTRTQGNWMVPPIHVQAVNEIFELLMQVDPAGAETYAVNRKRYLAQIDTATQEVRRLLSDKKSLPAVISSEKQAPFLRWLGFRVVATYDRAEDITASDLSRLASIAVDSGVKLFVDNLQSEPGFGKALAEATGVRHVTLSNFPLQCSYPEQLLTNVKSLLAALAGEN